MNRLLILAAASVICAGGAFVSMTRTAQANSSTMLYGQIEGFDDVSEFEAFVTFRDVRTREFLHRDKTTVKVLDGRYIADVETGALVTDVPYEIEIEGLSAEESFTMVDFVELQASTPGSTQTGHLNISGYVLASRIGLGVSPTIARVQVNETGSAQGVRSLTESGTAVYGQANALSGLAAGGYFTTKSVGGRAIVGDALSTTGSTVGGLFYNRSQAGVALWGRHINGAGDSIGVLGETASSNGTAIVASNSGSGDRAELAGANGSLYTQGQLPKHEYTNGAAVTMVPLAYGLVTGFGDVFSGSGNFLCTQVSDGVYDVTVNGASFTELNSMCVAVAFGFDGRENVSVSSSGPGMWRITNFDNNLATLSDTAFMFIIYGEDSYTPPTPPPAYFKYGKNIETWAQNDPVGFKKYVDTLQTSFKKSTRAHDVPIPRDEQENPVRRPVSE